MIGANPLVNDPDLASHPGLHALLIGISDYPHLKGGRGSVARDTYGMGQLASPCLSAFRLYQWLVRRKMRDRNHPPVPLASCYLLLAPSAEELQAEPELSWYTTGCDLGQFRECASAWRRAAASSPSNMTLFYFAGHGVQTSDRNGVLLMQDFLENEELPLEKSVDIGHIRGCMVPTGFWGSIARTQLYFVDACRVLPSQFRNFPELRPSKWCEPGFNFQVDDRLAPVFFAALPGAQSFGVRGDQTFLGKALVECLDGAAAEAVYVNGVEVWRVSTHSLTRALKQRLRNLSRVFDQKQLLTTGHYDPDVVLHHLERPPELEGALS